MERIRAVESSSLDDLDDAGDQQTENKALYNANLTGRYDIAPKGRSPRQLFDPLKFWQMLIEVILVICSTGFLVYAILAYMHHGHPAEERMSQSLLQASRYAPTIFPIIFAAIAGRFLRSVAAIKMEQGSNVLTLEYLLGSRTVFSTLTTPMDLRAFHVMIPFLIMLWALSPLGGQASLRIVSPGQKLLGSTSDLIYLGFLSDFANAGPGSTTVEYMAPSNNLFTGALTSNAKSKLAPQDPYGNIKIPLYRNPQAQVNTLENAAWRNFTAEETISWSALHGIPVKGLPENGRSNFVLNTAYMTAHCKLSGHEKLPGPLFYGSIGHSGANYEMVPDDPFLGNATSLMLSKTYPSNIIFRSIAYWASDEAKQLTEANCTVVNNFVEADVLCQGQQCQSTAVRPSLAPNNHTRMWSMMNYSLEYNTPINGLAQSTTRYFSFLGNFINATNPKSACTATHCPTSAIENYLAAPLTPAGADSGLRITNSPVLWRTSEEDFSLRFTQLINTYWLDSIAPFALFGEFNTTISLSQLNAYKGVLSDFGYYLENTTAEVTNTLDIIECHFECFAVLVLASSVLILASCVSITLNVLRKAPDIFDSFSSMLRYNEHAAIPTQPSLDDSVDVARRLRRTKVRFGDIGPGADISSAGLSVMGNGNVVKRLNRRKLYA